MCKVFCVTGMSGSGKSTIVNTLFTSTDYKDLAENLNLKQLIYHTTRKQRKNEYTNEYHFDSEELFKLYDADGKILEKRSYDTKNNKVYYYTLIDDIDLSENNYIVKSSYDQYLNYVKYIGKDNVVLIYIYTDLKKMINRLLDRAKTNNDIIEACRRIVSDDKQYEDILVRPSHLILNDDSIEKACYTLVNIIKDELS